jgi:phosphoglycerate dehydrogenase-like enzyme
MKKTLLLMPPIRIEDFKNMLLRFSPSTDDTDFIAGHDMRAEEVAKVFARAHIVLGDNSSNWIIGKELVEKAGPLKLIQQPSAGYDNIDVKACSERGIRVANTPGANTVSVAEHVIAMGLALLRKLVPANRTLHAGRWERTTVQPIELAAKTWGLVGLGEIGRAIAVRLRPFGLTKMLYYDLRPAPKELEEKLGIDYSPLPMLLNSSDIVSLHVPLTDSTRKMIGAKQLSSMKPGAYLVNVGRGNLIDEAALADALRRQVIAGAASDVFAEEPPRATDPLLSAGEDRMLLSPHVAGASVESAGRVMLMSAENIARVLAGQEPLYVVNP